LGNVDRLSFEIDSTQLRRCGGSTQKYDGCAKEREENHRGNAISQENHGVNVSFFGISVDESIPQSAAEWKLCRHIAR
jgi:hypothetical protein